MRILHSIDDLPQTATYDYLNSPVGKLAIITSPFGVHAILWEDYAQDVYYQNIITKIKHSASEVHIRQTKEQLNEYFAGKRTSFDLPVVLYGTSFQKSVWEELMKIPYGQTVSYAIQAERLGSKNKARAVGTANGVNPIPIIIPCHRVIGSSGALTGFGGGIDKKEYLLQLEKKYKKVNVID